MFSVKINKNCFNFTKKYAKAMKITDSWYGAKGQHAAFEKC